MQQIEMRPLQRIRVLVIEDDGPLRELYRQELVHAGYLVTAVGDGADALKRIDEGLMPDVVILDLALPTVSGLDVDRELKTHANTRNVPVIVVTGTDTREVDATHFAFVFRKPVQTETLSKAIDASVHR
jgi:two-component system phosphate regulon response regulator PhoB